MLIFSKKNEQFAQKTVEQIPSPVKFPGEKFHYIFDHKVSLKYVFKCSAINVCEQIAREAKLHKMFAIVQFRFRKMLKQFFGSNVYNMYINKFLTKFSEVKFL